MNDSHKWIWLVLIALLWSAGASAQNGDNQANGVAVVTVLPKHEGDVVAPSVANQDLSIKVNGKNARVTKWEPYKSPNDRVELVLLIDDGARSSLGTQLEDITSFVKTLPPNVKVAIGYMQQGRTTFAMPLSDDHEKVLSALHLPGGSPGYAASPYFCLSDLAKNWPSNDFGARREVVMVTDGVDGYQLHYDPEDPYVEAAMNDAVKAHLVVYAIYWVSRGRVDATGYENSAGQNLLQEVTQATGGKSFWQGLGNPVSFQPYFEELTRRLRNQYELGFVSTVKDKPEVETFKLKLSAPSDDVSAPQRVLVAPGAAIQP
ncbi:MAG: hypothetical protein ABSG96_07120 [Terracidiphilus sp.]|jgi:hypothetical protein